MTTTPLGGLFAGLVPGAVVGPVPAPVTGTPGDVFLALVQGLLDRTPDETPDGTPDNAADQSTGQPPGQPVTVTAPRQIEDAPVLMPEVADADTAVIAVPPPAVTAAVAAVVAPLASAPSATTSTTPAVEQPAITAATTETATPAPPPTPTPSPAPKVERPDVTVPETATPTAPSPAPATPAPAPAPTVPATALPVAPAPPGDTHRVTQQVFPEVVRVTTSPDGPQRVTVKLNPESLGEVRVVLTSRHGSLEVSITAGTEARTALVEGAPELQRLLESVGRGDSRIVVRDPAGVPTDPGTGTGTGPGTGTGTGGTGTGTGRPGGDARPDHHPRQHGPGSNTATDGAPATTTPSRRTESVTRARTGLDVTM